MMRGGNRWWSCVGGVLLALVCAAATASAQEKPAAPGQMNMADHRGSLQGRVRNGAGAAVTDTEVLAINAENGAEFRSTTDAQGNYSFGALPVGKYDVTLASTAGLTTFRRRGVDIATDGKITLDITLDAASAAEAAEFERQQLLEKIATLEKRVGDLETTAVLSEPETRVRRVEVYVGAYSADATSSDYTIGFTEAPGALPSTLP